MGTKGRTCKPRRFYSTPDTLDCKVLIVGGGGAGLRAALAASEITDSVVLATRGRLGRSGVTATACSDRMAFHATLPSTPPGGDDNWIHHAEDIYRIGGEVSDPNLAEVLAKESERAFDYLSDAGVPWIRDEHGVPRQFLTDGSRYPRACYTGPYTANNIHPALLTKLRGSSVKVAEQCLVAEMCLDESKERVAGAIALDERTYEPLFIRARAVVLATGGAGSAFERSVFPPGMTGDGYAMALRAGADLVNMEFIQLGLCSVTTSLACSGSLMRALPRIVDDEDRELLVLLEGQGLSGSAILDLLFEKGASWPVSYEHSSHKIDVLVAHAKRRGANVYLDYSSNPTWLQRGDVSSSIRAWYSQRSSGIDVSSSTPLERLQAINPESIRWLQDHGIDLCLGDRIEVEPLIQHFQGGIRIGCDAMTEIQGLYAAGECAGGQHGANRPGGSALLDSQVFGAIAGREAATYASAITMHPAELNEMKIALERLLPQGDPSAVDQGCALIDTIRHSLQAGANVIRTEAGLRKALEVLENIEYEQIVRSSDNIGALIECRNAWLVGRCVLHAALFREESRGPHLRFRQEDSMSPLGMDANLSGKMTSIRIGEEPHRLHCQWSTLPLSGWLNRSASSSGLGEEP